MNEQQLNLELHAALHRIDVLEERIAGLTAYLAEQARSMGWTDVDPSGPLVTKLSDNLMDSKFDKTNAEGTRFAKVTVQQINALSK